MKMILTFVIMMFSATLTAPPNYSVVVFEAEGINYYEPLIKAIVDYESKGDIFAFNFLEQACGPMQIRPIRIDHYNRMTGSSYTTEDCFNMEVSREVFLYFARGKSYEKAAKSWNGSGLMTINYWKQIQKRL